MRRSVTLLSVLSLVATLLVLPGGPAAAQNPTFSDIAGNVHQERIERLAELGITRGCGDGRYCPSDEVTRQEMATFLARALDLPVPSGGTRFTDVNNPAHRGNVEALARAGIVSGATGECRVSTGDEPPEEPYYCPQDPVNRNQMALFLQRAFEFVAAEASGMADLDSSFHRPAIGALLNAGVTRGCGSGGRYCGTDDVTRAQMASFLVRALDLVGAASTTCPTSSPAQSIGDLATQGFPVNSATAVPEDDRVYLFTNALTPQRLVVARLSDGQVLHNHEVPGGGTRVWDSVVSDGFLYFGRWGTRNDHNFFRVPLEDLDSGSPSFQHIGMDGLGGSTVLDTRLRGNDGAPLDSREFWALTADDDGRVYAGTGRQETVYRFSPPEVTGTERGVLEVASMPGLPPVPSDSKREITALTWTPNGLIIGTGRGQGMARVVAPEQLEEPVDTTSAGPVETSWETTALYDPIRQVFGIYGSAYLPAEGDRPGRVVLTTEEQRAGIVTIPLPEDGSPPTAATERRTPVASAEPILGKPAFTNEGLAVTVGHSTTQLYELDPALTLRSRGTPVPAEVTRTMSTVTTEDGSQLFGATSGGQLWFRDRPSASSTTTKVLTDQVDRGPERPQSLAAARASGDPYAVVGGNSKVTVHALPTSGTDPVRAPQDVLVPGETKATVAVGNQVFAATYPGGELRSFRIASDGSTPRAADLQVSWPDVYNRPRDIAYDARNDFVVVGAKADFDGYGAVISVRRDGSGLQTTPVDRILPGPPSTEPFTVEVAPDGTAVLGAPNGWIVGIDHRTGRKLWEVQPISSRVTGLTITDDGLIHALHTDGRRSTVVDGPRGVATVVASPSSSLLRGSAAGSAGELREVGGLLVAATASRNVAIDRATGSERLLGEGRSPSNFTSRPMLAPLPGSGCQDVLTFRGTQDSSDARIARTTVRRP